MSNVEKIYYSQVSVEKSAERKEGKESTLSLSFNKFTHFNFSHIFSRTVFTLIVSPAFLLPYFI